MLKKILSISGKPGLYQLISFGKNMIIVEGLADKKRFAAHSRDKIISLGDIAIYTTGDDVPLGNVLDSVYKKFDGKEVNVADYKTPESLAEFMASVLPEYDEDRVYKTDIKKLISWYNILVKAGFSAFDAESENAESPAEEKAE